MSTKLATTAADGAKDAELIPLLVSGASLEACAKQTGLSVSTVKRRLDDPSFVTQVIEARNDFLDRILGLNLHASMVATRFLVQVVSGDEPAPLNVRVRAAVALRQSLVALDSHVSGD